MYMYIYIYILKYIEYAAFFIFMTSHVVQSHARMGTPSGSDRTTAVNSGFRLSHRKKSRKQK